MKINLIELFKSTTRIVSNIGKIRTFVSKNSDILTATDGLVKNIDIINEFISEDVVLDNDFKSEEVRVESTLEYIYDNDNERKVKPRFLYIAKDTDDVPIYIGLSDNIDERMTSHKQSSSWYGQHKTIEYYTMDINRHSLEVIESVFIGHYQPIYNTQKKKITDLNKIFDFNSIYQNVQDIATVSTYEEIEVSQNEIVESTLTTMGINIGI